MRAKEFVSEMKDTKMTKRQNQSTTGVHLYGDGEHISGDYTAYRLGIAVAPADGKNKIEVDAKSWIGKNKSAHPYTQEESDMLKQAYKAIGANYKDYNKGDLHSDELTTVNTTSPVATHKKNKYGV
jgi:hypothetical protein